MVFIDIDHLYAKPNFQYFQQGIQFARFKASAHDQVAQLRVDNFNGGVGVAADFVYHFTQWVAYKDQGAFTPGQFVVQRARRRDYFDGKPQKSR